jgi:hypothetical protein
MHDINAAVRDSLTDRLSLPGGSVKHIEIMDRDLSSKDIGVKLS